MRRGIKRNKGRGEGSAKLKMERDRDRNGRGRLRIFFIYARTVTKTSKVSGGKGRYLLAFSLAGKYLGHYANRSRTRYQ